MSTRRRLVQVGLVTVVLGLGLGVAVPELCLSRARSAEAAAASAPLLQDRLTAWEEARAWYHRADFLATARVDRRTADRALDLAEAGAFDEQRRTLAWGSTGTRLHLDWLAALAASSDPEQVRRARLHQRVAALSYGERVDTGAARDTEPAARRWQALAALWWGNAAAFADLDARGLPVGAGLLGRHRPKPDGDSDGSAHVPDVSAPLASLVRAEAWRRAGDIAAARSLLAPLLSPDSSLAPLAAESWGLCLLDELDPEPPGILLAEARGAGPDPRARDALRAVLQQSPSGDPAWLGAWLTLAELDDRLGDVDEARAATWGAIDTSLPTWAGPPAELPSQVRLDAPGMVHPQRVQRARVQLDAARLAAERAGSPDAASLRQGVVALLLVQARSQLAARNLPSAHTLVDRARALSPDSPPVIAWSALTLVLDGQPDDAVALLDALPPGEYSGDLRTAIRSWAQPDATTRVDATARALRARLRQPWPPGEPLAFARVHRDQPEELWLALFSPPDDAATPAQPLAQSWLAVRVARALGDTTTLARAEAWSDAVRELVLDEPLWGLLATDAFAFSAELPTGAPVSLSGGPRDGSQEGPEGGRPPRP